jgi:hypothetical protein
MANKSLDDSGLDTEPIMVQAIYHSLNTFRRMKTLISMLLLKKNFNDGSV